MDRIVQHPTPDDGDARDDVPSDLVDIDALERDLHVGAARDAVAAASGDEERATALVTLGAAAAFADLAEEARDAAHQALGVARRTGDDELLLRVCAGRLAVHESLGDTGAMIAELAQLAAHSEALGRWDLVTVWLGALSDASGAAGDIDEALGYLERAAGAAHRSDDPALVAKVAVAQAEWTECAGRLTEARVLTEAAVLQVAGVVGAGDELAHQRCRLGMLSFRLEDFTAAHAQLLEAQDEFARLGLTSAAAQLDRNLGAAALHLGRTDEARSRLVAALDLARNDLDRTEEGRVALDLGELARLTSDYGRARRWYSLAASIAAELDDEAMAASACSGLASAATAEGRWREATMQAEAVLARSRARGDHLGTVNSLIQLGQLHRVQGEMTSSEQRLAEAVQVATAAGYALGQANASHGLGFLYQQIGRLGEAHSQFSRSLTFAFELKDKVGAANTLFGLNLVSLSAGRYDQAEMEARAALDLAGEVGYQRMEQHLVRQLAAVALARGDLTSARRLLDEARSVGLGLDDAAGVADSDSLLGELLAQLGETREAEIRLQGALECHRAVKDRTGTAVDRRRLGVVRLSRGEARDGIHLLWTAADELEALGAAEELAVALGALAPAMADAGDPDGLVVAARALRLLDRLAAALPAGWDRTPFDDRHAALRRRLDTVARPATCV